ncbi:hypothetical protein MPSEU_000534100 [Mayamaea pseudoterrestris]|nr:hypothetical protein MPSEU_000534100 [Mayamaea pseudoterrestris]
MSAGLLVHILSKSNANRLVSTQSMSPTGIAARLARKNILELLPYRCARDDYSEGILLDANENAFGPPLSADETNGFCLERYPDPYQIPLKTKLAAYRKFNIAPANIFVGVGSDEAIDLLMRIFCVPGHDQILTTPPTYGMYKVCAKVNDVDIVNVPLTSDFDLQVDEIIKAISPKIKLIFLCSPGNPTAKALPLADVSKIAKHAPDSLVIVDEAYIDFCTPVERNSALALLESHSNVCVLQTLSKAFGLAAIRCGFVFGPPDVVQLLNNVKAPYNVNELTSQMAIKALDHVDRLHENIHSLLEQRALVASALEGLPFVTRVYHSDANFILFRLDKNAQQVYKHMADKGNVVTRYRGTELHCDECIRVTIGTPDENQAFLRQLETMYNELA